MPDTPAQKPQSYPGRRELDAANARFRRAVARAFKEGVRFDKALIPQVAAIVGEATEHLLRLASDAEAAENTSERHKKELAAEEEKLKRALRRGARRGNMQAVRLLARVQERPVTGEGPHGEGTA